VRLCRGREREGGVHHHDGSEVELPGTRLLIVEPIGDDQLRGFVHEIVDKDPRDVGEEEGRDGLLSRPQDLERDAEPGIGEREDARVQDVYSADLLPCETQRRRGE
jgi:hypothetical protein